MHLNSLLKRTSLLSYRRKLLSWRPPEQIICVLMFKTIGCQCIYSYRWKLVFCQGNILWFVLLLATEKCWLPRTFDLDWHVPHLTWINIVQTMVDSSSINWEMDRMFTFAPLHVTSTLLSWSWRPTSDWLCTNSQRQKKKCIFVK